MRIKRVLNNAHFCYHSTCTVPWTFIIFVHAVGMLFPLKIRSKCEGAVPRH